MKEHEAFVTQAKSDYEIFRILLDHDRNEVPACHPLHFLQMATEKLAKGVLIAWGGLEFDRYSHAAFSLLTVFLRRKDVARKLGWEDFKAFKAFLRRTKAVFRAIDELNPSVGPQQLGGGPTEGPNTEYPWRGRDAHGANVWKAPAKHKFELMSRLLRPDGAKVLALIETLIERFDQVVA